MEKKHVNNKAAVANHLRTHHRHQKSPVQKEEDHHQKPISKTKNNPVVRREIAPVHRDRKPDDVDDKLAYKFTSAAAFGGGSNDYRNNLVRDTLLEYMYNRQMSWCTPGGLVAATLRHNNNIYFPTPPMGDVPDIYSDLPSFDHPIVFSDSDLDLDFFN